MDKNHDCNKNKLVEIATTSYNPVIIAVPDLQTRIVFLECPSCQKLYQRQDVISQTLKGEKSKGVICPYDGNLNKEEIKTFASEYQGDSILRLKNEEEIVSRR